MKPRFKILWLSPEDQKTNEVLTQYLDDGWMVTYGFPSEKAVMIVISKLTDALDGLQVAVDTALNRKKDDKTPR